MRNPDDLVKMKEIMSHIGKLFDFYGENEDFFDEYVDGVLKYDIEKSLFCFRDLIRHVDKIKKLPKEWTGK